MKEDHLSDDQLQNCLDGNVVTAESSNAHLVSCPQCREALAAYQSLYEILKEELPTFLSEDFADQIMPKLSGATSRRLALDRLISVVFISTMAVTAVYFLAFSEWLKGVPIWSHLFDGTGSRLSVTLHSSIDLLDFNPRLLLFVAITLISIGLIDHMVAKRHHHMNVISLVI